MAKKKPNPQDGTRRNIQAANKKIAALTKRVRKLEVWQHRTHPGWK